MHSLGMKAGYLLPQSHLPNPIDIILVAFQRVFPLDYILILAMAFFFVMVTISGLRNLGIWFFVIRVSLYLIQYQIHQSFKLLNYL
jgi:LMBR1 domain-containing protein 1